MGSAVSMARVPAMSEDVHDLNPIPPQKMKTNTNSRNPQDFSSSSSIRQIKDHSFHPFHVQQPIAPKPCGYYQHHHPSHHDHDETGSPQLFAPSNNFPHSRLHATSDTKKSPSHSSVRIHSRVDVSTKTKHTCNDHLSPTQEVHRSKSFSSSPICKFQFTRKIHSFPSSPTTQRNKSPLETTRQLVSQIEEDEDMTVVEDDTPWMLACRLDFFGRDNSVDLSTKFKLK
ncbi:hypothetical protein FDP41_004673 [Naegleria fowleri]|uniref:Uncharacterized protein n=1 Tax=Naegleria fowleri TaxID=5763 RepID=A0A6A5BTP7_NAEFO|nr:uncharacterized protein FDP41_004673 [Naegleria fowleri]KAF0976299.1 hypothetical protein FDP41_004673 [Naegleria fowleri]